MEQQKQNLTAVSGTRRSMKELVERFNVKWILNNITGCHEWTACHLPNGYGAIQYEGKKLSAHRVSWQLHNGEIPEGMHVLHKCDNRRCVNPEHLFVGTHQDNMKDRSQKGRAARPPQGDKNWAAKLIGSTRTEAKSDWLNSSLIGQEVAKKFGMSAEGMTKAFGPRGRPKGENNQTAKLTSDDVKKIRERLAEKETIASIARDFGVAWPQIKRIKTGEGWSHV